MSDAAFSLKDRVALVTGGSRGIGAAIARELAHAGAQVIVNYRSNEKLAQKVLDELREFSPKSSAMAFDIANPQEVDEAFKSLLERYHKLDVLVCNAGVSRDALLPRSTPEHFEEVFRTNFFGTVNSVRAASRSMMKNRYGRIICIGSVVGEMGNKGQSAYSASKSALFGFCKSVARELSSRQITCNVVSPGFIETEMTQELANEVKQAYLDSIPLGRFGLASDVARSVRFLASEEAGYITGSNLSVNGGLWM
ncbi:MAG: beta-ketoacyl-ACP reductase [Bradymonadales bacterium]|nr:MAG: beta-ketoacyl-ACP reductase [Bradymonadales bacterium]